MAVLSLTPEEDKLPLEEFVKLDTTVDFQAIASQRFLRYAAERPFIHLGTRLANDYIVAYTNEIYIHEIYRDLGGDLLIFTPKILSPVDSASNESAGITRVLGQPFLDLTGQDVIIGIIDTGIAFAEDAFRFEDGTTKLLGLWDQSIDGQREEGIYYGSTYTEQEINDAINSISPYSFIPNTDVDGHGTFIASVAAGNTADKYIGAAPRARIVAVRLRRARPYYIRRYLLSEDDPNLFESSDFLLGMKYVLDKSAEFDMPVVIITGMGSNTAAHDGNSLFEDYISFISSREGCAVVCAAGNEANARHHTAGIVKNGGEDNINIKVGTQGVSFGTIIFTPAYDKISISVTSPTGEIMARKPFKAGAEYTENLILEKTEITLRYSRDTNNTVWVGLKDATEGIWEITIFGDGIVSGNYQAWLPITGQTDGSVEFLRPVAEYTIVYPATAAKNIVCGAYNSVDGSLLASSSWGPTRLGKTAPDFTAPGVQVAGIYPDGFGTMTGTSVSAAVTAGAAALMLEWGIVKGNMPNMNGEVIRNLFIGGAARESNITYPNNKWGYGRLDLYGTFEYLRNR